MGFRELLDWWTHGGGWEKGRSERTWSSISFCTLLYASLPAGCSGVTFCNKLIIWEVKCFPETWEPVTYNC